MAKPFNGLEQSQYEVMAQMMKRTQELSDEKTAHENEKTAHENEKIAHQNEKTAHEYEKTAHEKEKTAHENEKTAHEKLKQQLLNCIGHLEETESCMKRVEDASLEEIKALRQLISHNKNVERAVAMNQQCLVEQNKVEATETQELKQRTAALATSRDKLEILSLKLQNKMLMAQNRQLRKEKGKKMSKTQKAAEEAQIHKLENYVRDVQTQLNHEKKEIVAKISRCNFSLEESSSSQELDRKLADCKKTKLAVMNDAEKQQIMTNISSIHTELQKAMDVSQQLRNERNEESKQELNPKSEQQISSELEIRNSSESMSLEAKLNSNESIDTSRQLASIDVETLETRSQEFKEANKDLETLLAGVKTDTTEEITKYGNEAEGHKKLLEAKFEDKDDLLWLGMRKLQQTIEDFKKSITEKAQKEAQKRDSEVKKLQQDQERSEKIIKELKEIMKKISTHSK